jgi:hypothetical protein
MSTIKILNENGEWKVYGSPSSVKTTEQMLTSNQQAQARENIGLGELATKDTVEKSNLSEEIQAEIDEKTSIYIGSGEMPEGYNIQIDPDAEGSTIPTKISDLTNDSGFFGANDIVPIENGGVGANNATDARANLGVAPAPIISQTDITAGSSALATGQSYHVYK